MDTHFIKEADPFGQLNLTPAIEAGVGSAHLAWAMALEISIGKPK
jgi:hypothetical protein